MKKFLILAFSLLAVVFYGCSDKTTDNSEGMARLMVTVFDAPAPDGIEELNLHVIEVAVHSEENGWASHDVDTVINFMDLVNGVSSVLVDDSIPSGYYDQVRLILDDSNTIMIDSVLHPLTVPSGTQTGVKLHYEEQIDGGEFVSLYIDFDIAKSVNVANGVYKLKPSYQIFGEDISGTISGMAADTLGAGLAGITVSASNLDYSTSTITDSLGAYLMTLPQGTYDVAAVVDSPLVVDLIYTGVGLNAGDSLTGYDFIIQ